MKLLLRLAFLGCGACLVVIIATTGTALGGLPSNAASVTETTADGTLQSRALMKEGAAKFAQGDWEGARSTYQRAWELTQHPAVAANMAAAEMKLSRFLEAAGHLRYAISHLPLGQSEKRAALQEQLDECRATLVSISLSVNVIGAEVSVDERSVGPTPLSEEFLLEAGHHTIKVTHPDHATESKEIDAACGQHVDLRFDLHAMAPPKTQANTPRPLQMLSANNRASSRNIVRNWTLVGGATATAISLGVGIVFRVKSDRNYGDVVILEAQLDSAGSVSSGVSNGECAGPSRPALCGPIRDKIVAYDRNRNISTGAFVVAGTLGLATVATAIFWPTKNSDGSRPSLGSLQLTPEINRNGSELVVTLDF